MVRLPAFLPAGLFTCRPVYLPVCLAAGRLYCLAVISSGCRVRRALRHTGYCWCRYNPEDCGSPEDSRRMDTLSLPLQAVRSTDPRISPRFCRPFPCLHWWDPNYTCIQVILLHQGEVPSKWYSMPSPAAWPGAIFHLESMRPVGPCPVQPGPYGTLSDTGTRATRSLRPHLHAT